MLQISVMEKTPRVERRYLRADADDAHVRDGAERCDDLAQAPGAQQQGIAAGQQNVRDFRMLGNVA